MCKCGLDMSVTSALKNGQFSVFSFWRRFIQTNYILICLQNIPNLSTMCKCALDMSVTSALKNGYLVSFHVGVDLPNQLLICFQNIPNLSTMCKCGLDMSVTSALKNGLFSVFSCWRRFTQTNY